MEDGGCLGQSRLMAAESPHNSLHPSQAEEGPQGRSDSDARPLPDLMKTFLPSGQWVLNKSALYIPVEPGYHSGAPGCTPPWHHHWDWPLSAPPRRLSSWLSLGCVLVTGFLFNRSPWSRRSQSRDPQRDVGGQSRRDLSSTAGSLDLPSSARGRLASDRLSGGPC